MDNLTRAQIMNHIAGKVTDCPRCHSPAFGEIQPGVCAACAYFEDEKRDPHFPGEAMKKPPLERKWFGIWHRHSWERWQEPELVNVTDDWGARYTVSKQRRYCLTCRKMKLRKAK